MKPLLPPDINGYTDFRKYLSDLFTFHKKRTRHFTYRYFSRKAGLGSPSALKEVIDAKKNLSLDTAARYALAFNLNKYETACFIKLVQYNQAVSELEKNRHYLDLTRLQSRKQAKTLTSKQYEYYSHWYNSAIRELAGTPEFQEDPSWIASRLTPAISPSEAEKSLELLLSLGLLVKGPDGRLRQESPSLEVAPDVTTLSIRNFNRSMISLGSEAIERFDQSDREVSGITLGMSSECAQEIKTMIREFKKKVLEYAVSDTRPANRVCQVNFQFFPLTQTGGTV